MCGPYQTSIWLVGVNCGRIYEVSDLVSGLASKQVSVFIKS